MSIKDLKNTTVMSVQKFHTKYWIEKTYYSCSWRKRFNCDQCGKNFARGCYLKVYIEIVHEKNFEFNCDHCGKNFTKKYFAKGFKLKVHIQNVHEIEKIRYESINDIMEMISTFWNLQNSNIKFVKRNY